MLEIAAIIIVVAAVLVLFRLLKGPRIYDRVLALNVIGTKTVVLIAVFGYMVDRPAYLDLALVYALINFLGTIAFLKYRSTGGLD